MSKSIQKEFSIKSFAHHNVTIASSKYGYKAEAMRSPFFLFKMKNRFSTPQVYRYPGVENIKYIDTPG